MCMVNILHFADTVSVPTPLTTPERATENPMFACKERVAKISLDLLPFGPISIKIIMFEILWWFFSYEVISTDDKLTY